MRTQRKLSPLWIALVLIAIIALVAYSVIYWLPGERIEVQPAPTPILPAP